MPDEPRKPGSGRRSLNKLEAAREAYENGETSFTVLAEIGDCSTKTISRKIKSDGWKRKSDKVREVTDKVIDIATRRAAEAVAPELQKTIADGMLAHAELERSMLQIGKATAYRILKDLQEAINANRPLRHGKSSELEEIKGGIEAIMKAIDGSREVQGIRPGQPSVPTEATGDTTFKFVVIADEQTA